MSVVVRAPSGTVHCYASSADFERLLAQKENVAPVRPMPAASVASQAPILFLVSSVSFNESLVIGFFQSHF